MNLSHRHNDGCPEGYEEFMAGWRDGWPAEGPSPEAPANLDYNHSEYQRGLRRGRAAYNLTDWSEDEE